MNATSGNMKTEAELKPTRNPDWATSPQVKTKTRRRTTPSKKTDQDKRKDEAAEFKRRRMALRKLTTLAEGEETYPRQADLGEMMCVTRNTITRWEMAYLEIPAWAWKLLGYIEKENRELFALIEKKAS